MGFKSTFLQIMFFLFFLFGDLEPSSDVWAVSEFNVVSPQLVYVLLSARSVGLFYLVSYLLVSLWPATLLRDGDRLYFYGQVSVYN